MQASIWSHLHLHPLDNSLIFQISSMPCRSHSAELLPFSGGHAPQPSGFCFPPLHGLARLMPGSGLTRRRERNNQIEFQCRVSIRFGTFLRRRSLSLYECRWCDQQANSLIGQLADGWRNKSEATSPAIWSCMKPPEAEGQVPLPHVFFSSLFLFVLVGFDLPTLPPPRLLQVN